MSRLKITSILDCQLIETNPYYDNRGYFYESFNQEIADIVGFWPKQENISKSQKNVLRGLHIQCDPPMKKIVRVLHGAIQDVIVDCRKDSKTYGCYESIKLSDDEIQCLFIPVGYAHGFCVLSDYAIVNYYSDTTYNPSGEKTINPFSASLNIKWLVEKNNAILSHKDKLSSDFSEQ